MIAKLMTSFWTREIRVGLLNIITGPVFHLGVWMIKRVRGILVQQVDKCNDVADCRPDSFRKSLHGILLPSIQIRNINFTMYRQRIIPTMNAPYRITPRLLTAVTAILLFSPPAVRAENTGIPVPPGSEQQVRQETGLPAIAITTPATAGVVTVERIRSGKVRRLKEIAAMVRQQRQAAGEFEGFVSWMSTNLAGYNRYLQAGSYAAAAAKFLPVPYAGQASVFTRFVAQFTVALNEASTAVAAYLDSSQQFITLADAIDLQKPLDEQAINDASRLADQKLLCDTQTAQSKLASVSDLSSGALSFLESLNHYVSGTDEYWNKVKGVFKKDIDPREKSFISENMASLRSHAARFNGRLKSFGELTEKETASIRALAVYDELVAEAR